MAFGTFRDKRLVCEAANELGGAFQDGRAGAALQGFDDGWADVDLVEPFDALHPARALRIDLHHLVADHIDADEVHAVGYELLAHRFDDAPFHVTDLERD
jgi:hypothetical protein